MHTSQNEVCGGGDGSWFNRRDGRKVGTFYKHILLVAGSSLECLSLSQRWKGICVVAGGCPCMAENAVSLRDLGGKATRHGQLMKVG